MPSISSQRMEQLRSEYEELKNRCREVDIKYSTDVVEPQLNLPPSLNLEKLDYVPKSEEELTALAEQEIASATITKQSALDKSHATKLKSFALQRDKLSAQLEVTCRNLADGYGVEQATIHRKLVNHGLSFSSTATSALDDRATKYQENVRRANTDAQAERELITRAEEDEEQLYQQSCDALEEDRLARLAKAYQKLADSEESRRISVIKYNNSLEEKEQRYQYSRERAYESAWRYAEERAEQNQKLYQQLGETGFRDMIEREKYNLFIDTFSSYTRDEGNFVLSIDSFVRNNLGAYYSGFVDWVNTTLVP